MKKTPTIKVMNRKMERARMKLEQGNDRIKEEWRRKQYRESYKGIKKDKTRTLDGIYKALFHSRGGVRKRLLAKLNAWKARRVS